MAREILDSMAPQEEAPVDAPGDIEGARRAARGMLVDVAGSSSPAESLQRGASALAKVFVAPKSATGVAARVFFVAALFLFPMALLAATLFESAYAPLNLVLAVRSIARAPLAYGFVVVFFFVCDLLLLAVSLAIGPALERGIGDPRLAHVVGLVVLSTLSAWVVLATASVLGAFRAQHAIDLGW